jgi:ketosteroid isomerase-like protein
MSQENVDIVRESLSAGEMHGPEAGRAKTSGVQTDIRYAVVYTLRDGKIVRGREYIDRDQALEALGLRE